MRLTEREEQKMSKMPREEVGHRIRFLREANQYTRDSFAEKIEVSSKFLYEMETGKKRFSVDILYRISKLLGVSCDYIMYGAVDEKLSVQTRELLEQFDIRQMKQLEIALEAMLKMCNCNKEEK